MPCQLLLPCSTMLALPPHQLLVLHLARETGYNKTSCVLLGVFDGAVLAGNKMEFNLKVFEVLGCQHGVFDVLV